MPAYICRSFKEAFIYDGFRNFKGRFRVRYLIDSLLKPAYSALVFLRLQQYFFWKSNLSRNKSRQTAIDRFKSRYYSLLALLMARINFTLNAGFEVNSFADIAPGLFIHHPQGVIIGGNTKIGKNCHLFKNVLFGDKDGEYPIIKDNVTLYANSVVVGGVRLDDGVVVAPNSVVIHDVEEDTIVAGIPAHPIKKNRYEFLQKDGVPTLVLKT